MFVSHANKAIVLNILALPERERVIPILRERERCFCILNTEPAGRLIDLPAGSAFRIQKHQTSMLVLLWTGNGDLNPSVCAGDLRVLPGGGAAPGRRGCP